MRLRRGFVILEVIMFMAIIALITPTIFQILKSSENSNKIKISKTRVKAISEAFERIFVENKRYVRDNCYGWTDVECANISATPEILDVNTLRFNTLDALAVNTLMNVGCTVAGGAPTYDVQCYDGYGRLMDFAGVNLHVPATQFVSPYNNQYPEITITTTNAKPVVIGIPALINNAIAESSQKINTISNAIKTFVRGKRIAELGNTCGANDNGASDPAGGLDSADDAIIPIVWESISLAPLTLCSGVENGTSQCGCSSHLNQNNWETSANYCVLDNDNEISRFLANVGLGAQYKTDGLGNPLVFVPLSNSDGDAVSCPPQRPQNNYTGLGVVPKSRVGVRDIVGNWVVYTDLYSE